VRGLAKVPSLTLDSGQTFLRLFVSPAPAIEGLEKRFAAESAMLQMQRGL
jgi:hypothetical protein